MANKLRRTLFIGLGGTGMNALLYTKKIFYDTYGEVPPMIGFLGIDTDGGVYNRTRKAKDGSDISLTVSEQVPIVVSNPIDIYTRTPQQFKWMPDCNANSLTELKIGAGQVRSNGRFALTINEEAVKNRITRKIQDINSATILNNADYGLLSNDTEVHLVFSLSGGTGCGTFLNIAYLIRKMFPDIKISGYAVMADVFKAMMQGPQVFRVRQNAYGAIKDLDFLMHLGPNSKPVEVAGLRDTNEFNSRPFTALYLIDNKNENNDTFSNVDSLCEMISLALVTSTGDLSVATASVSDNVAKVIGDGSMDILDKRGWAAGFGVSEIVLNNDALARTYANKALIQLIDKMRNGGCDDPSTLANGWIDDNHIRENLGKDDVIDYFMSPNLPRILADLDSPENPKPECTYFIENRAMEKDSDLDAKEEAIKEKIEASLVKFISSCLNRECGIFLAERVLSTLRTQIEICDLEMKEEIEELRRDLPAFESRLDTRCKELADCMDTFFKKGKKDLIEEVCDATMKVCRQRREIKRREYARRFYTWLSNRLGSSYQKIDTILSNFNAIYRVASDNIERIRQNLNDGSFFQFELALKEINKISCPPEDIIVNDFLKSIQGIGGMATFATMNSAEVKDNLVDFVKTLPKYKRLKSISVNDILSEMNMPELEQLCRNAIAKAAPLFTYNYHGFDAEVNSAPADSYFIGVADKDKSILAKNDLLKSILPGTANLEFAGTGVSDRIIFYRQIGVVPAFTISALDNYVAEYDRLEQQKPTSCHWDTELCRRMKEERFDLFPKDVRTQEETLGLWILAIICGLISYDNSAGKYKIVSRGLGGQPLFQFKVDMGDDRVAAYRFFSDNIDVLGREVNAKAESMDVPGPDNMLRSRTNEAKKAAADGTYLQGFSLCPITIDTIGSYPEIADLINKEMLYILDMEV